MREHRELRHLSAFMTLDPAKRVERLVVDAREHEHKPEVLLVYTPINVRYLAGFTGSHALLLIDVGDRLGGHRFLTDFRYKTQSAEQVPGDLFACEVIDDGKLLDATAEKLKEHSDAGCLGFDDAHFTVAQRDHLRELLPEQWDLVPCGDWSSVCGRSRNPRRSLASMPPLSSRTRRCARPSWSVGWWVAPSARSSSIWS